MSEIWETIKQVNELSVGALLILILIGGYRKWWSWGYQLTECEARWAALLVAAERRENEWKELALSGAITARRAVETLQSKNR
jgi:hypothetical protein